MTRNKLEIRRSFVHPSNLNFFSLASFLSVLVIGTPACFAAICADFTSSTDDFVMPAMKRRLPVNWVDTSKENQRNARAYVKSKKQNDVVGVNSIMENFVLGGATRHLQVQSNGNILFVYPVDDEGNLVYREPQKVKYQGPIFKTETTPKQNRIHSWSDGVELTGGFRLKSLTVQTSERESVIANAIAKTYDVPATGQKATLVYRPVLHIDSEGGKTTLNIYTTDFRVERKIQRRTIDGNLRPSYLTFNISETRDEDQPSQTIVEYLISDLETPTLGVGVSEPIYFRFVFDSATGVVESVSHLIQLTETKLPDLIAKLDLGAEGNRSWTPADAELWRLLNFVFEANLKMGQYLPRLHPGISDLIFARALQNQILDPREYLDLKP